MKKYLIVPFIFLFSFPAFAEIVKLKSGKVIEGKILERNDQFIKVDSGIGVNLTYYFDEITSINGTKLQSNLYPLETTKPEVTAPPNSPNKKTNIPEIGIREEIDELTEEEKKFFSEWLSAFLEISNLSSDKVRPAIKQIDKILLTFRKHFPESKLLDDAQVLPLLFTIVGKISDTEASPTDGWPAADMITKMEILLGDFPDDAFERFTRQKFQEITGARTDRLGFLYIPYKHIVTYLRGLLAKREMKHNDVIKYFSILKNIWDFDKYQEVHFENEIYSSLLVAETQLGNTDAAIELMAEVNKKFPDNHEMIELFETVLKDIPKHNH